MTSMRFHLRRTVPLLSLAALLAACGPQEGDAGATASSAATTRPAVAAPAAPAPARADLGTVTAIAPIVTTSKPTGAGAVVGGVLGAAVGNQIGGGNGRKVATVLGAVGGAKVGHEVERNRSSEVTGYRVDVKLDDGATRSFTLASAGAYAAGQRVQIVNGQLQPA